jgi:hypothetical protein
MEVLKSEVILSFGQFPAVKVRADSEETRLVTRPLG